MTGTGRGEPIDLENDYAARTTWAEILEGWKFMRRDSGGEHWDPPGRDIRATGHTPGVAVLREHGPLTVFAPSTEFEARRPYSKFEARAVLNHGGDKDAAREALHSQGFGVFRERDIHGNQIVRCGKYSYTWRADREPLAVGDTVMLPPAPPRVREVFDDKPRQAEVTQLGTGYGGPLLEVVRLVTRAQPE
jgi:hypothetical protein